MERLICENTGSADGSSLLDRLDQRGPGAIPLNNVKAVQQTSVLASAVVSMHVPSHQGQQRYFESIVTAFTRVILRELDFNASRAHA